jgi:hypothetical protein
MSGMIAIGAEFAVRKVSSTRFVGAAQNELCIPERFYQNSLDESTL